MFLQGSKEANLDSIKNAIIRMTHQYQGSYDIIPLHKLYCKGAARRKLSKFIKNDSFSGEVQVWNKLMIECNIKETHILSLTNPNICLFYRGIKDIQSPNDTITYLQTLHYFSGEFVVSGFAINNVRIIYGDLLYNHVRQILEQSNDPILGHILERLWWLMFTQAKNV